MLFDSNGMVCLQLPHKQINGRTKKAIPGKNRKVRTSLGDFDQDVVKRTVHDMFEKEVVIITNVRIMFRLYYIN